MGDHGSEILAAVLEIRDLMRVMAEPAVAQRDQKLRSDLRKIVGKGVLNAKAVLLMDGTRTQAEIHRETGIDKGQLSALVKRLNEGKLLTGDSKQPKLSIPVLPNFFESTEIDE